MRFGNRSGNLLTDAGLRERMGLAAHRRVASSYAWDQVAERYESILQTCTESLKR